MNRTRLRWPVAAVALALAVGCSEDSTAPAGSPSTVSVRAYVDADGTGTFTAGDVPVASQPVVLEGAGGASAGQANTNAQGIATFTDVRPGTYSVRFTGAAPAGAVLASATQPVVVAPFDGGEVSSEFRFVFNPGQIAGVLYRDNNSNNVFDPGTDTPAPGITVQLFRGSDTTSVVATTVTSANGAFVFNTLRPGSYTVRVLPLPTMQIVGGNTISYTVGSQQTTAAPVRFTGNLLSTIAQVRAQPAGTTVAFEGVATVSLNIFSTSTTGNQFNVQDATGGVLILDVPLSTGVVQGDSVRVIGTTQISSGEYVIRTPTITRLGTGTVPAPRTVTGAQVAASTATDPLQGILVRVGNVRVTAVSGTATSTAYNVTVMDDAGNTFIVRVGSANTGIPQTYWQIGRSYDVTGLLGNFNGAQVKVRSAADVQQRSLAQSIGAVRAAAFADSAGTLFDTVTVEGVVHTAQGTFRTDNAFIQDATGGILLFNVPTGANLVVGDSVRVTAAIDWFNSELELVRFSSTSPPVIEKLGTGAIPQPRTISGAQFLSRVYEGQLVRVQNARFDSAQSGTSAGYNAFFTAADGSSIQLRVENANIGLPRTFWTAGNLYNIVGALSHFRGIPQVKPRSAADVTPGTAGVISIAQSKLRPVGDTVVVEGVVTAPVGIFGSATGTSTNAYISDGTAGTQIFGVPSTVTLDVGDIVRVRGVTSVFSGEQQIARFSSSQLLEITELGTSAPPVAIPVTGAQVAARTFEGQLVRVDSVVVVSVGTVSSSGGYNVTVRAPDGTEFVVRNDRAAVGVPVSVWSVGAVYDVTGILSAFNSAPQLKVRGIADVVQR
jgi:DNA/RNA endonuclease YhcR with UshA esterase domain